MSESCKFPGDPQCGEKRTYSRGCRHEDCCAAESRYRHERYLLGKIDDPSLPKRKLRMQPMEWMIQGNCVDRLDVEWVPGADGNGRWPAKDSPSRQIAREFCGDCPVRKQCLEYGIATKSMGIWGGSYLCWEPRKQTVNLLG